MISFYRFKRYAFYITLLAIPFLIFMITFFTLGLKHYNLGNGVIITIVDPMNTLICIIITIVVGVIIIGVGNRFLRHPLLSMLEGKGLLAWILDSTGLIGTFMVDVNAPKLLGKKPGLKNMDLEENYDTDIMHRIIFPKAAPLTTGYQISKDITGKMNITEKKILVLPDEESKHDTFFKFESVPVFIYNKVMGMFLSRDILAKNEKDIQLKHSSLNILYKLGSLDAVFRDFGRYAGEVLRPKKEGLFSRVPWLKYAIIAIVIIMIVLVLVMLLVPGLLNAGSGLQLPM